MDRFASFIRGRELYVILCMGGICIVLLSTVVVMAVFLRRTRDSGDGSEAAGAVLEKTVDELLKRAGIPDDDKDPLIACFHARLDYFMYSTEGADTPSNRRWLGKIRKDIEAHEAGFDIFSEKDRSFMCGYLSEIDGTVQPFRIALPEGYSVSRKWPVMFRLHGQGMFRRFQGRASRTDGMITVAPHGRGGMDYKFVGEIDVIAVLEQVKRLFSVDEDRIYLAGHSMGGTGAWHIATRFPEHFAAIFPVCGNTDIRVWEQQWGWRTPSGSPQAWVRDFLRDDTGSVVYAENLLNTHILTVQGEDDPVVNRLHTERMISMLQKAGHDSVVFFSLPYVMHRIGIDFGKALMPYTRKARPAYIRYRTAWLKYPGPWWVKIRGMGNRMRFASIEAKADPRRGRLAVSTENVNAVELIPGKSPVDGPLKNVVLDGSSVSFETGIPLVFEKITGTGWRQAGYSKGETVRFPPRKTASIEGPAEHAFMSRFYIVCPTRETSCTEAARNAANRLCVLWKYRFGEEPLVLDDSEITEKEVSSGNLILFGSPEENTVTAKVIDKLPVCIKAGGIEFGGKRFEGNNCGIKLCYPNPLNPARYVVLVAGTAPESYTDVNRRFGNWFDWVPYDYRWHFDYAVFDDMTTGRSPETFLVWGFFDENWEVDAGLRFDGVTGYRSRVLPRVLPEFTVPPKDADMVGLEYIKPAKVILYKEYIERNRSLDGAVLQIKGKQFKRGITFRFPGKATFPVSGFSRFRVTAGIEWNGITEPCEDRKRTERAVFKVTGDQSGELFYRDNVRYCDDPFSVDIDISREKTITLSVYGGRSWLNGSCVWAEPVLEK